MHTVCSAPNKIRPDSGKKISGKKIGFSNFKVRHSGYNRDPPQNQILMGVIALAFFDPRSSRGPQSLPESAIWKNAYLALEPKRFEIWFLLLQWPPLLSDFKGDHFHSTFWSEVIQGYLWGKMLKMRGLPPNQYWPADFFLSSKKNYFCNHI